MIHQNLIWFKHASFLYNGSKKIYFDPWEIYPEHGEGVDDSRGKADIILVTHDHYDHFSPETIEVLRGPDTIIVGPHDVAAKLSGSVKALSPSETADIRGVSVEGVRAYNVTKSFHPKENNWLGYVVSIDGIKIYHAGDTDHIDEMKMVETDIALLPVGGTYTMDVQEAIEAARVINPRLSIPMHYGYIVGSKKDGEEFVEGLGAKAEVMRPGIPFENN